MQQLIRFVFSFSLLCMTFVAFADGVSDLATVTLPVADQTQPALFKIAPEAMRQALIKMTDNPSIASNPDVEKSVSQASQWIQSFTYTTVPGDNNASTLLVTIHFDVQALNHLLAQAKQPFLPTAIHRPMTLVWITVNQGNESSLAPLASGDQSAVGKALTATGIQMGWPILLPAMDLEDQAFVNNNSTLPFNVQKLMSAGARYKIPSILAGNLSLAVDGSWQAQWIYLSHATPHQWQASAVTPAALFQKAFVSVGNILSTQPTAVVRAGPQVPVSLQVMGVSNLNDYALVMNDLKQIAVITHVIISELNGTIISFQLDVAGGQAALEQALQHNADFTAVPTASLTPDQIQKQTLYYQFNSANVSNKTSDNE